MTFETTSTDGGSVVEIMTETPSVSPTKANNKSTVAPAAESAAGRGVDASATAAKDGQQNAATPRRRPLPKLIPIGGKQAAATPPPPPRADDGGSSHGTTASAAEIYYGAGHSALGDFASLIDDDDDVQGAATGNVVADGALADAPKSSNKTAAVASFFDKLKAKAVDETAGLTCPVCRYESKCLSEFMRHQRAHGDDDRGAAEDESADAARRTVVVAGEAQRNDDASPPPAPAPASSPLPPVTAAELKSTRCQRCRKRCKTSAELMAHLLATCRGSVGGGGTTAVGATAVPVRQAAPAVAPEVESPKKPDDDGAENDERRPAEKRIFVWNTAALPVSRDAEADDGHDEDRKNDGFYTETVEPPKSAEATNEDEVEIPDDGGPLAQQQQQQKDQQLARKEGKIYKTVSDFPFFNVFFFFCILS